MTALIQIVHHRAATLVDELRDLDYPLVETDTEWVIMGFSNPRLSQGARRRTHRARSTNSPSLDSAMRDAFRKARRFLMTAKRLTEDEAISLLAVGVDFGVSQVVNGNWGVHAIIRKAMFTSGEEPEPRSPTEQAAFEFRVLRLVISFQFTYINIEPNSS